MTYLVPASAIRGIDFKKKVEEFATELANWKRHDIQAELDKKNDVPMAQRHMPYPSPKAHLHIMNALNDKGELDYKIIDDSPSAKQHLEEKKAILFSAVSAQENAAKHFVQPRGKARLQSMRAIELTSKLLAPEDKLSKSEKDELDAIQETIKKIQKVELIGAQAHSDIEDLTLATIDNWSLPSFEV